MTFQFVMFTLEACIWMGIATLDAAFCAITVNGVSEAFPGSLPIAAFICADANLSWISNVNKMIAGTGFLAGRSGLVTVGA